MVDGLFNSHFICKVEGSCVHTRESRVAHVHGNALMCSSDSMVEGSPSRTAHVWGHVHGNALTCSIYPQWWRGAPHVQVTSGSCASVMPSRVTYYSMVDRHSRVGLTHVWRGHLRVGLTHMWRVHSRVAHVHSNALTCSISSMADPGAPHVQLTCGSHAR